MQERIRNNAMIAIPLALAGLGVFAVDRMAILQQERLRMTRLQIWAKKHNASVEAIWKEWYKPLAAVNQRDFVKNRRIAAAYLQKAEEARRKLQAKAVRRYALGAQLFQYYAQQNKKVVEAYRKGDETALRQACAEILKVEIRIRQVLRTPVVRDWLTPQELEQLAKATTASAANGASPNPVGQNRLR